MKETLSKETLSLVLFFSNKEDSNQSDACIKVESSLTFPRVINRIAVLCICCLHESQVGSRHILLTIIYKGDYRLKNIKLANTHCIFIDKCPEYDYSNFSGKTRCCVNSNISASGFCICCCLDNEICDNMI